MARGFFIMEELREVVISKEDAVFWMDGNGRWCNEHGAFEHKKIIDYFHASIKKDRDGYHLFQVHESHREKVYFRHEDCAIFVFDVLWGEESVTLRLNTGKRITLNPENLWIKDDHLYTRHGEDRIKFDQRSLMKISKAMEEEDGQFFIRLKNERFNIKERS